MQPFTLAAVPEIVFGAGKLAIVPSRVDSLGGANAAVVIVADPAMRAAAILPRLEAALAGAGHKSAVYDAFKGEPKSYDIDKAATLARDIGARVVVGLGGGTALDTAKLVACCAVSGRPVEDYGLCANPLPKNRLPIIAIATTAGTGAEVTRTCIFATAKGEKVWAWGDETKPDVAILDPEVTVGVPAQVTAMTGLDAMVHAIEASTNRNRHEANDVYCHRAISLIAGNLLTAIREPHNLEARGAMLLGSCYAGIGIDNCSTGMSHCISHAMADLAPIPHGRATGLAMMATFDWVIEGNPKAFANVAQAMGEMPDAMAAATAFEKLVRASGIKISFDGDGLELNRPDILARHMASPANTPMRSYTARDVSDDDLLMLAQRVYALR
jgi:alcohol dehydrogenase class IV